MAKTIFAEATARGRAGVSVIRISGPDAFGAAAALAGHLPDPRQAGLRWLRDPASGETLDQAVVLGFKAPGSFTGEDTVELHVHGSPGVCRRLLSVLGRLQGLRGAEPGEFTRRALMNGRLDLAQVEGLADLLSAETAAQQRHALAAMEGALSRLAASWRSRLVEALALVEATIDFADEELPGDVIERVRSGVEGVAAELRREIAGSRMAERIRDGFEVALVGPPNVGKSTLLNALAGRDAALTSEVAGTTRDVIEVRMDLEGLPLTLLDMAGLREAGGEIEALGIERARTRARRSDMRIFLVDEVEQLAELGVAPLDDDLVVRAKADLRPDRSMLSVSGRTGEGIEGLLGRIAGVLRGRASAASSVGRERQRAAVAAGIERLEAALGQLRAPQPQEELLAEELREALRALDVLVGKVDVEAVLDVVFKSFCLGK